MGTNKDKEQKEVKVEKLEIDEGPSEVEKLKAELAESQKELQEQKRVNKYQAEQIPLPENQKELPTGLQDSKTSTKVHDIKNLIKEKMMQLKDFGTLEVQLPTHVRLRNRLKAIKQMSQAKHIKVKGIWHTERPDMYITKLEGKKLTNEEMQVSFGVFEVDEKGDKLLYTNYADVRLHDGSTIKRPTSAEYRVGYEVIETIKTGKPITREVIKINKLIQN